MAEAIVILVGACFLSMAYKLDANWDRRSCHIHGPFALLDGRLARDLYAAGPQTYFNPFLDVLYYGLSVHLLPERPAAGYDSTTEMFGFHLLKQGLCAFSKCSRFKH